MHPARTLPDACCVQAAVDAFVSLLPHCFNTIQAHLDFSIRPRLQQYLLVDTGL